MFSSYLCGVYKLWGLSNTSKIDPDQVYSTTSTHIYLTLNG